MIILPYRFYIFLPLVFIFLLLTKGQLSAQSERSRTRIKVRANDNFKSFRYHKALPDFLLLDSLDGDKSTHIYPIAVCYVSLDENEKALPYILSALRTPERYPSNLFFYAGRAFHLEHRFEEAIANYDIYKTLILQQKKKDYQVLADIYREIEMCRYGLELVSKPTDITIRQLGANINSPYPDYAPVITADEAEIIFTSSRPSPTNKKEQDDGHFFEDVYISEKDSNGSWLPSKILPLGVERTGNLASISLTPDGHKLLIYQAEKEFRPKNSSGNLFVVEQHG
ncbi:MAG TPA: hypothetical protein VF691_19720, partial [Cytophagaceae bacterium]